MEYLLHILILMSIYAILAVSLNLVAGCLGLISAAHAATYGVGAYVAALVGLYLHLSFPFALLLSCFAGGVLSLLLSATSMRLSKDFFVLATLSFRVVVFSIFNNFTALTGGPMGLAAIPRPVVLGLEVNSKAESFALSPLMAVLCCGAVFRVQASPFGRVLTVIREDEILAKSYGKNAFYFKAVAFFIGSAMAAAAGAIYALYIGYIEPTGFSVQESVLIIAMVVLGGAGGSWGPLLGAVTLVALPEALRFAGFSGPGAAHWRQFLYGGLLVLVAMVRPRGLLGRHGFGS